MRTQSLLVIVASMSSALHAQETVALSTEESSTAHENLARGYQAELLSDAALRMSATSDASGFINGRFTIGDGGENSLWIGGMAQIRYQANSRSGAPANSKSFTHGFETRRTRLRAGGTIWEKNLSYKMEIDFSRSNGSAALFDFETRYRWDNGLSIRAGQFKGPFTRELVVADSGQLVLDRSILDNVFSIGRVQGIEAGYQKETYRGVLMINDGLNTLNTDYASTMEADLGVTARAEWLWAGKDFKRFDQMVSWRESSYTGMLGGAVHYQTGGETAAVANTGAATTTPDVEDFRMTLDASMQGDGWDAFAAFVYRRREAAPTQAFNDFGFLVQGGYFVTNQLEAYAQYYCIIPDDDRTGGNDPFNVVTIGANYHISPRSHAVKLSGDIVLYLDDQAGSASLVSGTSNGPSNIQPASDGQVGFRLQLQVMF